jgi:hypothetical protein
MTEALAERLARAAERQQQAQERRAADPSTWGVSDQTPGLAKVRDAKGQVLAASRRDVFDALLHGRGLTAGQHIAARRLIADWATSLGLGGAPAESDVVTVDYAAGDQELVNGRMIGASDRVRWALQYVGPASARVLAALVEPLVMVGVLTYWRGQVQRVAGETEAHAQGAVVRHACENLRMVYQAIDRGELQPAPRRAA